MKYCTHCGCEVVDDASVCPKCGSELSVPSTYKKSKSSNSFDGGKNGFAIAGCRLCVLILYSIIRMDFWRNRIKQSK